MRHIGTAALLLSCLAGSAPAADNPPVSLAIDVNSIKGTFAPKRYVGSNLAIWEDPKTFPAYRPPEGAGPGAGIGQEPFRFAMLRLPGGSLSDTLFWNGNGPRDKATGRVDVTRMKDGYPDIDYSDYAPTILVDPKTRKPRSDGWHGSVDVRVLHAFAKKNAADTFVCVNGGTGRPVDAAEWVRWANGKMGYNIRYWEVGQELDGDWEGGHFLPDGTELTPGMYAQRFKAFADAMKAADPNIRVGGPGTGVTDGGFIETLLRDAGDRVDFISIHSYPGNATFTDAQQFARARAPRDEVAKVRKWIQQYQPQREKQIEVAYSEWNLPAARVLWDMDGALWSALWLRDMATMGVDFACQWDLFGIGGGGVGLLYIADRSAYIHPIPRSQFWTLALWARNTGPQLLSSGSLEGTPVESMTSRDAQNLYVMLVNTSRKDAQPVRLTGVHGGPGGGGGVGGIGGTCRIEQLTYREYFWDIYANRPVVSTSPIARIADISQPVETPPFSLTFVTVPLNGASFTPTPPPAASPAELRILAPAAVYANEDVEVWIRAVQAGTDKPATQHDLADAVLTADQPVTLTDPQIRLRETAGRTFLRATRPGKLTLTARSGDLQASRTFEVKPSEPRPVVIWDAEEAQLNASTGYESDFAISKDLTARPNEPVVRVDLKQTPADDKPHPVLKLTGFPAGLDKSAVRGAQFDIKLSPDFKCDDPNAYIRVILQSEANWWIDLGTIPLDPKALADWQHRQFDIKDEGHIKAMPYLLNVWLNLNATKPVTGSVYLDRIGLMVR